MTLSIVEAKVITLLPDDTIIKTYTIGDDWGDAQNRIGEKKRLQIEYNSDVNITGHNLYINAALFMREDNIKYFTGKGTVYYTCNIPDATLGNVYYAPLQTSVTTAGYNINVNQNFLVRVLPNGGMNFKIQVDFFMVQDCSDNYIRTIIEKGISVLTSDANAPGNSLDPTNSNMGIFPAHSVYKPHNPGPPFSTQVRSPRVYVYSELPGSFPLISASIEYKFVNFKAGWYNQNAWASPPWFINTGFELKRSGNVVIDFSSTLDTDVEIYAESGDASNHVTKFLVWIIRQSQFDPNYDFYTNLDAEFKIIELANVSTGKIKAPMTDPTNTTGNVWKGTFKVGPLSLTDTYRLVGVAYSDNVSYKVNSFISPLFTVVVGEAGPGYAGNGFDAIGAIDDYNKQFEGNNLECCIEERMRAKVKLYFPFDKWKNDIFNRLGLVTSNDIRRYMTAVKVEIFEEYTDTMFGLGNVKNIFESLTSNKIGATSYSAQSGLSLDFGSTWFEMLLEFRNRFEANTPNLQTLINGVNTIPVMTNQYWGGRTLTIRWTLTFFYDNYSTPFSEEIVFNQQIRVKDYGQMAVRGYDPELNDFDINDYICDNETLCFLGVLQNPSLEDRKLITNIYPKGSGVSSIEEAEVWVGNQLPQITTNKITDQDEDFSVIASETAAKFCVDGTKLLVNSYYVISALAKKYNDTGKRITELSEPRITEANDRRTIDNL